MALLSARSWEDRRDRFADRLPLRLHRLEDLCRAALSPFWEEPGRPRALRHAEALSVTARLYGYTELARLVRALASLFRIPLEEVATLEEAMREKVLELLGLLEEFAMPDRRTA